MTNQPKCERCEQLAAERVKDALELLGAKERIAVLEARVQHYNKRMEVLDSSDTHLGHTAEEWYRAMREVQDNLMTLLESLQALYDKHV